MFFHLLGLLYFPSTIFYSVGNAFEDTHIDTLRLEKITSLIFFKYYYHLYFKVSLLNATSLELCLLDELKFF